MSARALFTPGSGDYYTPVNDLIATLPRDKRHAADLVWKAILDCLPPGETSLFVTDWRLSRSVWLRGYSLRFVQKGLLALSPLDKTIGPDGEQRNPDGIGLIDRMRRKGRRKIIILARLRGRPAAERNRKRNTADARTLPIPNVGTVRTATAAELAAAQAAKLAAEAPRESSADDAATAQRFRDRAKAEINSKYRGMTVREIALAKDRESELERTQRVVQPTGSLSPASGP